jgi:hypothetical protein
VLYLTIPYTSASIGIRTTRNREDGLLIQCKKDYRVNALKITFKREARLHTQDTRDYVEAGWKDYR